MLCLRRTWNPRNDIAGFHMGFLVEPWSEGGDPPIGLWWLSPVRDPSPKPPPPVSGLGRLRAGRRSQSLYPPGPPLEMRPRERCHPRGSLDGTELWAFRCCSQRRDLGWLGSTVSAPYPVKDDGCPVHGMMAPIWRLSWHVRLGFSCEQQVWCCKKGCILEASVRCVRERHMLGLFI